MNRRTFLSAVTGYVEAQNLLVARRFAAFTYDRLPGHSSARPWSWPALSKDK